MPRNTKRAHIPGLSWRAGRAYVQRQHAKLPGGRLYKALGTSDPEVAHQRIGAINTLMERGDWNAVARWARGELDISDLVRAVRTGEYTRLHRLSAEGPRLGQVIDTFLRRTEATLSAKTYATYASAVGLLQDALGDDFPLAELSRSQAEAFLHAPKAHAKDQPWAPRSQGTARTIYKALWSMAIEQEAEEAERQNAQPVLVSNPWRKARVPRQRKTREAYLSREEWFKLIEHPEVRCTPRAALLALACLAGLRRAEIAHLRTGIDVVLGDDPVIRIQSRRGDHPWRPKHDHSERDIEIGEIPALVGILTEHVQLGFAGRRYFIHVPSRDRPISPSTAEGWTRDSLGKVGLRYGRQDADALTLHSLRHTFGTWLAAEGVPFHVIASLMGNTAAVVMATYAHVAPSDRQGALRIIGTIAS